MNNINNLKMILSLGIFEDKLKFTKLIFELQSNFNLFNYSYIRKDYGPYSEKLEEDIKMLISRKELNILLKENERTSYLSLIGDTPNSTLSDQEINFIKKYKNKSRKEILSNLYNKYNIFTYELGDIILAKNN